MNAEFSLLQLKQKITSSVIVLGVRKVVIQIFLTSTNVLLARILGILGPEIFGVFAIIHFLTISFGLLTNFGLGPALVQKKGVVSKSEMQASFTWIMIASLIFVAVIYISAPLANIIYQGKLGADGIFWLRIYALSVLFDHLAAISLPLLERRLEFQKLTVGEIITTFVTSGATVILAYSGLGVGAFVLGTLLGKITQMCVFWYLSPWPIGINFSFKDLRALLPFGRNYQANTLIGAVNSAVIPGFVGAVSGPQAVGFITWAGGVRQAALSPTEVIERLIFTTAARVQDKEKILKLLIEKMLRLSCLMAFPLLALVGALAPEIVTSIFTKSWLNGLTALYLSLIQGVFILLGVILMDVLLALGEAKKVRNITFFWALLQWILTVPFVWFWNFNGAVVAGILVSATFFIPLRVLRRRVKFAFIPNVLPYLVYSSLMGITILLLSEKFHVDSFARLITIGGCGVIIYVGILLLCEREKILKDFHRIKALVK